MNGAFDLVSDGSSSSVDDPLDMDIIRQWMDHHDWDMLDESAELRRDKDVCLKLLLQCYAQPTGAFELKPEFDSYVETLSERYPAQVPTLIRLIYNGFKRFTIARRMDNDQAAKEVEIRQVKLIEDSKLIPGFLTALRELHFPYELPESVQSLMVE